MSGVGDGQGGSYQGTAVPPVGGISYSAFNPPANWQDPAVSGKDLMVHRDVLREVPPVSGVEGAVPAAVDDQRRHADRRQHGADVAAVLNLEHSLSDGRRQGRPPERGGLAVCTP